MTSPNFIENLNTTYQQKEFSKYTKIRSGNLWSISNDKTLIYANLNKTQVNFQTVPDITGVMFMFVSGDGKHCVIRVSTQKNFILLDNNLTKKNIGAYEKSYKSVTFVTAHNGYKYIFFGCNEGKIVYTLVNNPSIMYHLVCDIKSTIMGIIVRPQKGKDGRDYYTMVALTEENNGDANKTMFTKDLHFFQLNSEFVRFEKEIPINCLNDIEFGDNFMFTDENYVAAYSKYKMLFIFQINKNFEQQKPYSNQDLITIQTEFSWFAISNDMIFTFNQKTSESSIYQILYGQDSKKIVQMKVPEFQSVEFDPIDKSFYLINKNNLRRLVIDSSFPEKSGPVGFYQFLYNTYIQQNKIDEAIISLINSKISFNTMVNMTKSNPVLLHKLFISLVDYLPESNRRFKKSIALRALEMYVRIESSGQQKLNPPFYEWVQDQMNKGNLSQKVVCEVLDVYGWNEPYGEIIKDKSALIDHELSFGGVTRAAELLSEEKNSESFTNNAIRLFNVKPNEVINAIYTSPKISQKEFAPMISSPSAIERIYELKNGKLKTSWLRAAFVLQMAKDAKRKRLEIEEKINSAKDDKTKSELQDELIKLQKENIELADAFFTDQNQLPTKDDCDIAYRAFFAANEPRLVAIGLKSQNRFAEAAVTDPEQAINIINEAKSQFEKKRTTISVLRAMETKKAGDFAQRLLNVEGVGIDSAKLIDFLPDSVSVSELENAVDKYIEKNTNAVQDQKKMFDEAKDGIARAHKLVQTRVDPLISISSMESCACCGKLLFTGQGVVFPCKHGFHTECIKQMFQKLNIKDVPITKNCPLCSFLSTTMISRPFTPSLESLTRWSTNQDKLKMELSNNRSILSTLGRQ
ncbi:hypothetical protein TVAG_483750 [Trichomonas vaginalis G3]|uniref:RING-type domain-containing protein n=1 Tax=Trichomonas vaginalis (strain ATCC PRA-98 / G3) TaxID=412133 RepID=A2EA19_TRIV3|nr:vacuolar protein sorting-associated protein 18-like protein family [Trichomonas vaginalis G3]EAY10465.1 hypothetical protein TVAG_483750 [Trichomonas vaginalis G3]KAI5489307.1 vacuolar protein sorting-associated protein 18-like protein family [Trichomonas vaginalis G3]|eukprot:XP_001322688.1 hypothetical protein [Trichomonas vaginalis G3]